MVSFQLQIPSAQRLLVSCTFQVMVVLVIWWQRQQITAENSSFQKQQFKLCLRLRLRLAITVQKTITQVYNNVYLNFKSTIWLIDTLPVKAYVTGLQGFYTKPVSALLSSKFSKWWNIYWRCDHFPDFDNNIQFHVIWQHRLRRKNRNLPDCLCHNLSHTHKATTHLAQSNIWLWQRLELSYFGVLHHQLPSNFLLHNQFIQVTNTTTRIYNIKIEIYFFYSTSTTQRISVRANSASFLNTHSDTYLLKSPN